MKKRTAFLGAILSLLPLGQPLLIKTGVFLSTTGFVVSKNTKKIFYLPIGVMGIILVLEKELSRRFKRKKILSKIKSFQETK